MLKTLVQLLTGIEQLPPITAIVVNRGRQINFANALGPMQKELSQSRLFFVLRLGVHGTGVCCCFDVGRSIIAAIPAR